MDEWNFCPLVVIVILISICLFVLMLYAGFFPVILGKGPWPKLGKMIKLTSKLGEINDIEHNKDSKIYPQNQVIFDCITSSIPLKYKCLSISLIWVIVSDL